MTHALLTIADRLESSNRIEDTIHCWFPTILGREEMPPALRTCGLAGDPDAAKGSRTPTIVPGATPAKLEESGSGPRNAVSVWTSAAGTGFAATAMALFTDRSAAKPSTAATAVTLTRMTRLRSVAGSDIELVHREDHRVSRHAAALAGVHTGNEYGGGQATDELHRPGETPGELDHKDVIG